MAVRVPGPHPPGARRSRARGSRTWPPSPTAGRPALRADTQPVSSAAKDGRGHGRAENERVVGTVGRAERKAERCNTAAGVAGSQDFARAFMSTVMVALAGPWFTSPTGARGGAGVVSATSAGGGGGAGAGAGAAGGQQEQHQHLQEEEQKE